MLEKIRIALELVGALTTLASILLFFWAVISLFLGVYPLFLRLGFGRWKRKIAIVADDAMYGSLKADLVRTGIFREKNIYQIKADSLADVRGAGLALVHYQSFTEEQLRVILSNKRVNAGFIFYFPEYQPPHAIIPPAMTTAINNEPFSTIVTMRGRLVNDVVTTLLSTSYER